MVSRLEGFQCIVRLLDRDKMKREGERKKRRRGREDEESKIEY